MPKHKTKGPLSLQGAVVKQLLRSDVSVSLSITHRDSAVSGRGLPAYLHPSSIQQLCHEGASADQVDVASTLFLQLASGSDCVLHARASVDVPAGCIEVDEVQQANLRLCAGETYKFSVFEPHVVHASSSGDDAAGSSESDEEMQEDGEPAAAAAAAAGDDVDGSSDGGDAAAAADSVPFELTDLDAEVRLLHASTAAAGGALQSSSSSSNDSSPGVLEVDARVLSQAFCKQCFGRVLAVNEYVVVELPDTAPLLLRVTATNTLTAEEQQEAIGYHCYRGLLTPDTKVYLSTSASTAQLDPPQSAAAAAAAAAGTGAAAAAAEGGAEVAGEAGVADAQQQLSQLAIAANSSSGPAATSQQQQLNGDAPPVQSRVAGAAVGLQLVNAVNRAAAPPATNLVHVYTSDGEWFPVKKKLLRPCIALTKVVRDSGETAPSLHVAIDTLTFDRLLIFLEAQAMRRTPPGFAIHLLDDLQQAAGQLGLRSLQDYCAHLLGSRQAALGVYSFADVQRANASGKVWLLLDGMVLDVGRWLPEHPGGAAIIPAQSLDCDCSRFFEMYHASRESFLYLQEFYIGELVPADVPHVPLGGKQPPSQDFLAQLREYTAFRQPLLQQLAQSTPATHLGASKRLVAGH